MNINNLQNAGARVIMRGDLNDPEFPYYNPSIAYDGEGKLRISIRSCNFTLTQQGTWQFADGSNYAKSKVLYGYVDPDTLEVSGLKELTYSPDSPYDTANISGLEDARLYWREDGMHFIGVEVNTKPMMGYPGRQAEYVLDEATGVLHYQRTMIGESPARTEKNWLPTNVPAPFEYSYSPTETIVDGKLHGLRYQGFIHGSSQLLWQEATKSWLALLHSKHILPMIVGKVYDKYIYVHYLGEYNEAGLLVRLSPAFTFGLQDNIEFVAGMVEQGSDLVMALGAGDARFGFARINKARLMDTLKPYGGIEDSPLPPMTNAMQQYIARCQYEQTLQRVVPR